MKWFVEEVGLGTVVASIGLSLLSALLLVALTGLTSVGIGGGSVAGAIPIARSTSARRRRRETLAGAWPDALSSIVAGIRAGMALPECCCALSERGPEPLRAGFGAFAATYRASGSFAAGLGRLRDELEDPVADRIAIVLEMADEVGGNDLVRILRTTSDFIRADLHTRGEVRARWSWTLVAARLAAGTPLAVLVIMSLRPEARAAYDTPVGTTMIVAGWAITWIAYRLMLLAGRLPEEGRLG
jgi:tight adherence protein B